MSQSGFPMARRRTRVPCTFPPGSDSGDFSFYAVGGQQYTLYGQGDNLYIPNWSENFTAWLDRDDYKVSVYDAYSHSWSGNVLCGPDSTGA